jgi:hypothetical protein
MARPAMRNERGLAASSLRNYGWVAGRFLADVGAGDDVGLERDPAPRDGVVLAGVTAAAVTAFMRRACQGRARATAKVTATALRSLLRYLCLHGHTALPLAPVVVSAACWRLSGLPESLDASHIVALLNGCDRQIRGRTA